jgi:CBS domain-containing protein
MHSLVKDLMTTQVVTVGPATPFKEIVALLAEHRVSAVPVVDDDRRVLGIVSEADLLLKEEFPGPDQDIPLFWTKRRRLEREKAAGATAGDFMSSVVVVSTSPDATVAETARRMHAARGEAAAGDRRGRPAGRNRQPRRPAEGVQPNRPGHPAGDHRRRDRR